MADRRLHAMLSTGHVIVCGLDHLGLRTIDELRMRDEEVVGIGVNDDAAEHLADTGVRLVVGDPLLARVLSQADVETASAIVMTGDDDLANLNMALAAVELNASAADRHPDVRPGARLAHPGALPRRRRPLVLRPRGTRLRVRGDRRRDRHPLPAGGPSPRVARIRRTRPAPRRRSRSPGCTPDRSVELLPDAPSTDPNLILVDVGDVATEGSAEGGRRAAATGRPGRPSGAGCVESIRARFRAPEQRLLRFGAILVVLAVGSAVFFDLVAGLTPLDAVSYAITLLTGASLPADIQDAARQHRVAGLCDLPEPRRGGHRGRRLRVHHRRAHPVAAPPDARPPDRPGRASATTSSSSGWARSAIGSRSGSPRGASRWSPSRSATTGGSCRRRGPRASRCSSATPATARCSTSSTWEPRGPSSRRPTTTSSTCPWRSTRGRHDRTSASSSGCTTRSSRRGSSGASGIRFTRSVSHLAAPAFAAAAVRSEVIATVPVGDRRVILFARLRVPKGSRLEGRLASSLGASGALRVLAVADPGSEAARWDFPADEVMDPGEEVVVAATRAGLGIFFSSPRPRSSRRASSSDA